MGKGICVIFLGKGAPVVSIYLKMRNERGK